MKTAFESVDSIKENVESFQQIFRQIQEQISTAIVGNQDIVNGTLASIFAGGHVLLEGAPGLGKTLLVRSIADSLGLSFKRIQFTPDLMPSDVTGTQVLTEDEQGRRTFQFKPGPIFAHIVLADEINRATPKTQSSLLEAMEEKQVTVLGDTHVLEQPFFVLATQNPIELEGTYPLPEAQLDRFLVKLLLEQPDAASLKEILKRTTGSAASKIQPVLEPEESALRLQSMKALVREVSVAEPLQEIIVRLLSALNPESEYASKEVKQYVRFGPGPRGAQAVMMLAKVYALLAGRINLAFDDIKLAINPALRHRLILNFQADAEAVNADNLIDAIKSAK